MRTMRMTVWAGMMAGAMLAGSIGWADTNTKLDNADPLNVATSWSIGKTNTWSDIAIFDNTLSAANSTLAMGDSFAAGTILVEDVQGGLLTLTGNYQLRPSVGGLIVTNSTDLHVTEGILSQYATGGATWRIGQGRTVMASSVSPNYKTVLINEGTLIGTNAISLGIGARSNTHVLTGSGTNISGVAGMARAFSVGATTWTEAQKDLGYINTIFITNATLIAHNAFRLSSHAWNVSETTLHNAKLYATEYLEIGYGDSTRAIATISGSSIVTTMTARVGRAGFGTLNLENGEFKSDDFRMGVLGGVGQVATGRVNQTGGTLTTQTMEMQASGGTEVRGYYTLSGGTLSVGEITRTGNPGAGTDTSFTFDGGTIKPLKNNATWLGGGGGGLLFTSYLTANGAVVNTDGFNVTINNILENAPSETGTLTKFGAGTLTLAGNNLYTGATTVEAGKLVVNGSMGGGMITVKNGAELGGASTGAGPVTLDGGSTLSPGNSIGTLEVGDLTLEGTTTWVMELDNDGSTSDQVSLSGTLTAGFTFEKVILDFLGGGVNGSYLLIPTFSSVDSLSASDFEVTNLASGLSGTIDLDTTANEMILTVIPEPGTLGALGLFAVAALLRRRLRR